MAAIDSFYGERGLAPSLELSPLTDPAIVKLLGAQGYVDSKTSAVSDALTATRYGRR